MSNDQTTETGTISGSLRTLAQVFAIVTPYASTDKAALKLIRITGNVFECCDSYAAIRHTDNSETTTTTHAAFTLPASEVSKALTAAAKLAGKRAGDVTATITATPERWTLNTNWSQTISGTNPQHETPNTAAIWRDAQNTTPTNFEPFSLAAWQLERLAKTTKQAAGTDQPATLTHYSSPIKPVIYTISAPNSETQLLIMPTKPRNQ
jgi:hypothetical protein